MVKTCKLCGTPFEATRNQRYCSPQCSKEAQRRYGREYQIIHKEAVNRSHRKWYHNHKEQAQAYQKRYYREKREEKLVLRKQYYEAHREEILEREHYTHVVKPKMEACRKAHDGCFSCPTGGDCPYD